MFNPETANVLPNGAQIVQRKCVGSAWVWLAYQEGQFQPYVTWVSNAEDPGGTYWGHYYGNLSKALVDYHGRINEQWPKNTCG